MAGNSTVVIGFEPRIWAATGREGFCAAGLTTARAASYGYCAAIAIAEIAHIRNILKNGEVDEKSNVQKMHIANADRPVTFYGFETQKHGGRNYEIR